MRKKYLPAGNNSGRCVLLIGCMLLLYFLDNLPLSDYIGYDLYSYAVKPLSWILLYILAWVFPRGRTGAQLKHKENLILWGFIFGFINVMASIAAGFIDGFGKSPYSHSFTGMLMNSWVIGSFLVGREYARGFLVNSPNRKEKILIFILVSTITTLMNYPMSQFASKANYEELVTFIARYLIPEFCQNLLATYLAYLGGWLPSLVYMASLQAFQWLSPILPDLEWITSAFIGILCPVFSLIGIQNMNMKEKGMSRKSRSKPESTFSLIATSVISICIIWFAVGVFPIYPSVIATGSMEPVIQPGDMIIIRKVLNEEGIKMLKEGDIIQFERDDILVSHRIFKVIESENQIKYCTKGDNNFSPDSTLVMPENVRGKIICVVPKIGWPTLLIKKKEDAPLE
jgi:signal peptidase